MPSITMMQVARKAGVSQQVVSKVINKKYDVNEKTRERVEKTISELNYQPNYLASSLRSGKRSCIGIATGAHFNEFDDIAISKIVNGLGQVVEEHNNFITFCPPAEIFGDSFIKFSSTKMVDGIVLFVYGAQIERFKEYSMPTLKKQNIPFVVVHFTSDTFDCPYVGYKTAQAGELATRHMADQELKDIALITYGQQNHFCQEIRDGYSRVVNEFNLNPRDLRIEQAAETFSVEYGYECGRKIIKDNPDIQGYVVFCDLFALGLIEALKESGKRVPEDICVVGIDNLYKKKYMFSHLTSVDRKFEEQGRKAAEFLFDEIENGKEDKCRQILLEPELIIRQSSLKVTN